MSSFSFFFFLKKKKKNPRGVGASVVAVISLDTIRIARPVANNPSRNFIVVRKWLCGDSWRVARDATTLRRVARRGRGTPPVRPHFPQHKNWPRAHPNRLSFSTCAHSTLTHNIPNPSPTATRPIPFPPSSEGLQRVSFCSPICSAPTPADHNNGSQTQAVHLRAQLPG